MKKRIIWIGDCKERLKTFPEEVRRYVGYALSFAESGEKHPAAKPLKGIKGVFEIVVDSKSGTYRVVYAIKINDELYVLHAFQKKSKTGIAIPKKEIDLIKERLKKAKEYKATK